MSSFVFAIGLQEQEGDEWKLHIMIEAAQQLEWLSLSLVIVFSRGEIDVVIQYVVSNVEVYFIWSTVVVQQVLLDHYLHLIDYSDTQ